MAFRKTCAMEERIKMLGDYDTGAFSVTELSAPYGVSRETFYAWRSRRASGEPLWFADRSHAPGTQPLRTDAALVERIEALRRRFPYFGPKKIRARLHMETPDLALPAASTIGDILTRAGLVEPVRRRRRSIDQGRRGTPPLAINSEWCIYCQGWFRTLDGQRVDPLTVTDNASRYLLQVQIVRQNQAEVKPVLERLFNEFGLPMPMRSDNGAPFGSTSAGGLSRVSIWLLKLGVDPHYGRPAKPQDNGRHERMHRTLKEQTPRPPAATAGEQQLRFNDFRLHFNDVRPHESLEQTSPAKVWTPSDRPMPTKVEDPWYDADHEVRRVRTSGDIKWRGEHMFIGEALAGEVICLAEHDDGRHVVSFAPPRARRGETVETKQELCQPSARSDKLRIRPGVQSRGPPPRTPPHKGEGKRRAFQLYNSDR